MRIRIFSGPSEAVAVTLASSQNLFFQLHDQSRTVFAGPLIFPGPLIGEVFKVAKQKWESGLTEDEGVYLVTTRGPPPERRVSHNFFFEL